MSEILERITTCVEFGKVDKTSPFPPDLKGQDGADELTKTALEQGVEAEKILKEALVIGMDRVGQKFSEKKIFIPQMLMSAKAMNAAIEHLKPFFQSGALRHKGEIILATVKGDLHDIGKNLVKMAIEGSGWKVFDLGVDVGVQKILTALEEHPEAAVGLSSLLTTTMQSMHEIVTELKSQKPDSKILIGGAPVNEDFRNKIGADFYSPNPQGAVKYLNELAS